MGTWPRDYFLGSIIYALQSYISYILFQTILQLVVIYMMNKQTGDIHHNLHKLILEET